ncbi:cyclic AMP-responsive element-binding protein 3-like protein 3 [Anabrus simplex]|uniref:cyclic AMP-responsive element-binding protein 3-like protein 3 n=1 Tax=Anabrus simplex TaxID=316456 RepID=UPI0035A32B56
MTVPSDISLMDFLFEREDPLFNVSEKDANFKSDPKDNETLCSDTWPANPDDFLNSLLEFENHPFEILSDDDDHVPESSVAASSCSDSGLSSDQQLSPMMCDDGSDNVQQEIELDSSVFNVLDTSNLSDVKIEDNQAVISMNVLTVPNQVESLNLQNVLNKTSTSVITPIRQVIRVTPVTGNPRSLLLPVNLKDVKDIKTIKIINTRTPKLCSNAGTLRSKPVFMKDSGIQQETSDESSSQYPRLQLTSEEKRLLQKEGVHLPSHYPLTKHEERELKRIRRKIRNKISAQDSRKRKKEYIDGLEDRVKKCTEENVQLVKRIKALQTQNQSLTAQLKRLQGLLARSGAKSVQPATCLMVLLLSMALVLAPNFKPDGANTSSELGEPQDLEASPAAGRSRSLLFSPSTIPDEVCPLSKEDNIKFEKEDILSKFEKEDILKEQNRISLLDDHDYDPPPSKYARLMTEEPPYVVPPLPGGSLQGKVEAVVEDLKMNVSDRNGPRSVVLQVPKEQ